MTPIDKILGEAITPDRHTREDPMAAYYYSVNVVKGRWPDGEAAISKDNVWSYYYAKDVINGRFPEGEAVMATDPWVATYYALLILKRRWPEAEEVIAKTNWKKDYLEAFPEAKEDWVLNGWLDWLDT